jgi:uncharacterized protein YndB with AHSA1/START domain
MWNRLRARGWCGNRSVASNVVVDVTRSVILPAAPDVVWTTITTPEELSVWFGEVLELDARAGGSVLVRDPDGATRRGTVDAVEPGRRLVFRWRRLTGIGVGLEVGGASRVTLSLEPDPGGTRLTVTEEPVELATSSRGS